MEPTKIETLALVANARRELLRRCPFLASIILQQEVSLENSPDRTIATTGKAILLNPQFLADLSPEGRVYVLAHCAWHCALLHFWRRGQRDKVLWDMACEVEVFNRLRRDNWLECPEELAEDDLSDMADIFQELSAEEIYEKLSSNGQPNRDDGGGQIDQHLDDSPQSSTVHDSADGDAGEDTEADDADETDDGEASPAEKRGSSLVVPALADVREVAEMLKQAVEDSGKLSNGGRRKSGSGIGDVPGEVLELLDSLKPPSQDWRAILADFVVRCHADQRRWYPSSRRHVWRGVYLPSIRSERLNAVVAIDTSGSTSPIIDRFFSELLGIIQSVCTQYEITLIECDCKIQHVQQLTEFSQADKRHKWKVHGLGGTDFRPVFDYVEENGLTPDVLIYFTDGEGPAPTEAPEYPVIWVIAEIPDSDCAVPCDWGIEVKIPIEALS